MTLTPTGGVVMSDDSTSKDAPSPDDAATDIVDVVEEAGYTVAFDTANGDEVDLSAAPEPADNESTITPEHESTLPSQALAPRVGRPLESQAVMVEGTEETSLERKFIGSDGKYHNENPRARQAFEDYLNMGAGRTLAKLAEKYHIEKPSGWENNDSLQATMRKLSEYSANFAWQDRIRLTLARQTALAVTNAQKQAAKNRTERIRRSQKLQDIAEHIFDRAAILGADEIELPPEVARQLIKPAIQMMEIGMINERLEAGESLERIKPPKPIDQMDEGELDEYIDLLRSER